MTLGRIDTKYYKKIHPDLAMLSEAELVDHYRKYGMAEGRLACPEGVREGFIALIPRTGPVLEIGPFASPALSGAHVRYADVLTTDELRSRARALGLNAELCPEINYALPTLDLSAIQEKFAAVISSHCIEHQPDIVRHLQDVERILAPNAWYFVIVPDKRYCFDHFLPESTIADVVSAHFRKACVHDVGSVVEHWALTTHNDSSRHWEGNHGRPNIEATIEPLKQAIAECRANPERYIDVHAWQFTPASFHQVINLIADLGWTSLRPIVAFPTVRPRNEFCAVLGRPETPADAAEASAVDAMARIEFTTDPR
jgi:SAM-dependent methyltransferase